MKQHVGVILAVLLAASMGSFGRAEETLEQLISRADAAQPKQQPDLYMQVAERELKITAESYKANKPEDGRAALQQIVNFAGKAHSSAIQSGKRLKHTEIKIRQIAGRLRDMKLNIDVDDQGRVQSAIDKLEDFRTELFRSMFGAKSND
jgi:hypothetical protein